MTDYNKLVEKQIRGILKDISENHGLDFDDLSKKYLPSSAKELKEKARLEAKATRDKEKAERKTNKNLGKLKPTKNTDTQVKVNLNKDMQEYRNKKQIEWEQKEQAEQDSLLDEDHKLRMDLSMIYTDPLTIEQEIEYRKSLDADSRLLLEKTP